MVVSIPISNANPRCEGFSFATTRTGLLLFLLAFLTFDSFVLFCLLQLIAEHDRATSTTQSQAAHNATPQPQEPLLERELDQEPDQGMQAQHILDFLQSHAEANINKVCFFIQPMPWP